MVGTKYRSGHATEPILQLTRLKKCKNVCQPTPPLPTTNITLCTILVGLVIFGQLLLSLFATSTDRHAVIRPDQILPALLSWSFPCSQSLDRAQVIKIWEMAHKITASSNSMFIFLVTLTFFHGFPGMDIILWVYKFLVTQFQTCPFHFSQWVNNT